MDQILDSELKQPDECITYGSFWQRCGAITLDTLIIGVPTFAISYYNITNWKSIPLLVLVSLAGMVYKPYCEFQYGATPGKKALNLNVVNQRFDKADLTEIILRNIFQIVFPLMTLAATIMVYNSPEFQDINGFMEFGTLSSTSSKATSYITWMSSIVFIIEFICLVSDQQKRALHDRIGKTYVIVNAS